MVKTLTDNAADIDRALRHYRSQGQRVVVSSSFQTHSIPLLHLLQQLQPGIPVAFLDTGYHFAETTAFRDHVVSLLDLNLVIVSGERKPERGTTELYAVDETACCNVNKVEPMHQLLTDYDVWISGVRATQTNVRQHFDKVMAGPANTERYHPMLDWSDTDIASYRRDHDLPSHPLDAAGFASIGCAPCTTIPNEHTNAGDRSGRWSQSAKTECGLHLREPK